VTDEGSRSAIGAMGRLILARIDEGETIKAITADPAMPAYCTVFQWVKMIPEFGAEYRALRARMAARYVANVAGREASRAFWGPHKAKVLGKRWWRRGRGSSYTREVGEAICARLRRGETMMAVNADPAMPSAKVVYGWMRREPEFREMVMEARGWWLGWLEFHRDNVADLAVAGRGSLAQVKRRVARIEARIGRLTPKHYRPRV
jgi:hypothetical protein